MDDKHPETTTVTLGGKDRKIKLGPAAFRIARIKHGVTLTVAELGSPSIDVLAQLAWIGMLPDDPELEELAAMQMIASEDDEAAVLSVVAGALSRMTEGMNRAFSAQPAAKGKGKK